MNKQLVTESFKLWCKLSTQRDTWDKDGEFWRKFAKLEKMAEHRYMRRVEKMQKEKK